MLGDIIIAKLIAYIAFVGFNKNIYIKDGGGNFKRAKVGYKFSCNLRLHSH